MKKIVLFTITLFFLIQAQGIAEEYQINFQLLDDDQYVIRTGSMITKSNQSPKLLKFSKYDQDKKALEISNLFGEITVIPIENISEIIFDQKLNSDPTYVQSAQKIVSAQKGKIIPTTITLNQLVIQDNVLTLLVKDTPKIEYSIPEVLSIIFSMDSCTVNWQWVRYKIVHLGGGGSSVGTKGIR